MGVSLGATGVLVFAVVCFMFGFGDVPARPQLATVLVAIGFVCVLAWAYLRRKG